MDPPVDEDRRPKIKVRFKSCDKALSRTNKHASPNALKQHAVECPVLRCMRCGDGGHAHEDCKSKKPIWGKDWKKRRECRKLRRSMRQPVKKYEGDVGVKSHQSACAVREPTMLKAAAATRCSTTDEDRRELDAIDNAGRVKGLHAVPTEEMRTAGRVDGELGKTDLGHDESGAGARTWTSIDGRFKEVEEPKDREIGLRRLQQGEQLKDVALVSNALDEKPAMERTVPDS